MGMHNTHVNNSNVQIIVLIYCKLKTVTQAGVVSILILITRHGTPSIFHHTPTLAA